MIHFRIWSRGCSCLRLILFSFLFLAFTTFTGSIAVGADKTQALDQKQALEKVLKMLQERERKLRYDPDKDKRKFKQKLTIRDVGKLDKLFKAAGQSHGLYRRCEGGLVNRVKYQQEQLFSMLEKTNTDYQIYKDLKKSYDGRFKVGYNHVKREIILKHGSDWSQLTNVCNDADRQTGMEQAVEKKIYIGMLEDIILIK